MVSEDYRDIESGPDSPTGDQGALLSRNQQGFRANQSPAGVVAE